MSKQGGEGQLRRSARRSGQSTDSDPARLDGDGGEDRRPDPSGDVAADAGNTAEAGTNPGAGAGGNTDTASKALCPVSCDDHERRRSYPPAPLPQSPR